MPQRSQNDSVIVSVIRPPGSETAARVASTHPRGREYTVGVRAPRGPRYPHGAPDRPSPASPDALHGGLPRSMRPLAALERFLERLFERPSARLLGAHLEPVTLARRVERAMDEERRVAADGMLAPTRFAVRVSQADVAALARLPTLEDDLAAVALDHARRRGYRIPERPIVALLGAPELAPGDVRVTAGFADASGRLVRARCAAGEDARTAAAAGRPAGCRAAGHPRRDGRRGTWLSTGAR